MVTFTNHVHIIQVHHDPSRVCHCLSHTQRPGCCKGKGNEEEESTNGRQRRMKRRRRGKPSRSPLLDTASREREEGMGITTTHTSNSPTRSPGTDQTIHSSLASTHTHTLTHTALTRDGWALHCVEGVVGQVHAQQQQHTVFVQTTHAHDADTVCARHLRPPPPPPPSPTPTNTCWGTIHCATLALLPHPVPAQTPPSLHPTSFH